MKYIYSYDFRFGNYSIVEEDGTIVEIFKSDSRDIDGDDFIESERELIKRTYIELEKYLEGTRKSFTIPINPKGTDFQKLVWDELLKIPYGETRSYKDIALSIGRDKAFRAVGNANNKNPIAIIIPCHRVVGSDGKLTGYAYGLEMKGQLLELERKYK